MSKGLIDPTRRTITFTGEFALDDPLARQDTAVGSYGIEIRLSISYLHPVKSNQSRICAYSHLVTPDELNMFDKALVLKIPVAFNGDVTYSLPNANAEVAFRKIGRQFHISKVDIIVPLEVYREAMVRLNDEYEASSPTTGMRKDLEGF